jgi:hypothetical protein
MLMPTIANPRYLEYADPPLPDMPESRLRFITERFESLGEAHRRESVDLSFGDREIYWHEPGADPDSEPLAFAYYGRGECGVTLYDEENEVLACWEGDTARRLLKVGVLVGRERNDSSLELTELSRAFLAESDL